MIATSSLFQSVMEKLKPYRKRSPQRLQNRHRCQCWLWGRPWHMLRG